MKFTGGAQLKAWIKNKSRQTGVPANTLLQSYMMERLLERSLSRRTAGTSFSKAASRSPRWWASTGAAQWIWTRVTAK
jgi:hypothetical protein